MTDRHQKGEKKKTEGRIQPEYFLFSFELVKGMRGRGAHVNAENAAFFLIPSLEEGET